MYARVYTLTGIWELQFYVSTKWLYREMLLGMDTTRWFPIALEGESDRSKPIPFFVAQGI